MKSSKSIKHFTTEVLKVYKKVNPSVHFILNKKDFDYREKVKLNIFENLLKFPRKMFENAEILEFGSGTGDTSIYYSRWGAKLTGVEMNNEAITRCKKIYKKYHKKKDYKFINQSLFDYKKKKLFDIVTADGVLHHTDNPKQGFKKLCSSLKFNGYLIYGTNLSSGRFLRNLQRFILFKYCINKLGKIDHNEIERLARKFFKSHLHRAKKFGNRSIKAIIYDDYINPKIKSYSLIETLRMFDKNNLKLYSAWPPISFTASGQTHNIADTNKQILKNILLNQQLDLMWAFKVKEDKEVDNLTEKLLNKYKASFQNMIEVFKEFSNIDPYTFKKIDQKKLSKIKNIKNYLNEKSLKDIENNISVDLVKELNSLYNLISLNSNEDKLEKFLNNTKFLFKGYSGVGINYFICKKN